MAEAQTSATDPIWDSLVKQAGAISSESADLSKSLGESAKVKRSVAARLLTDRPPPAPEIPAPIPPPNAPAETNPMQSFGGLATVLGIMGGMLTRAPLTASLNAASGAMTAYKQRDLEAYKRNYDTWKAQSDYLGKIAEWQQNRYKAVMDQYKDDHDSMISALTAISAADNDTIAQHTLRTGDLKNFMQLWQDRENTRLRYADSQRAVDQLAEQRRHNLVEEEQAAVGRTPQQQLLNQYRKEHPDATAEDIAKFLNTTQAGKSPQAIALRSYMDEHPDATADEIAGFLQKMRPQRSAQAMAAQKFIEEHPGATADDISQFAATYAARNKAVASFATGKQGDILASFNKVTEHLNTLDRLATDLQNKDTVGFNKVANAWSTQFGGTAPNNFNSAKQIVGDEIVKAIVGAGGGVGDREKAQDILDAAKTPEQLHQSIGTIRELIFGQLKGLKKQYEDTTGRSDFDSRLTGAAREMLLGGHEEGGKKRYQVNDIIEHGSKKYRVTGGDPSDPDVEEVK